MSDQVHVAADEKVNAETVSAEPENAEANATLENEPKAESVVETGAPVSADAAQQPQAAAGEADVDAPESVAPESSADALEQPEAVVEEVSAVESGAPESVETVEQPQAQVATDASQAGVEASEAVAPETAFADSAPTPPEPSAQPKAATEETSAEVETSAQDGKRVVRVLSVGQEITGTVKRIAEFGAFIDIGVGRDGLIHISELSSRRVGKVTDVLQEGQEITAWIKKLDRDRNRISLTLIDPGTKTIRDLNKGDIVQGTVTRIMPYGAFIDIGIGRDALLHVREMSQGYVGKPEDVVKVGEAIEARVVDLSRRRSRVDLSLKGLRPEPEPEVPAAQAAKEPEPEPEEPVAPDPYEEVEVLSPMELAFKRAMEAGGAEFREGKGKRGKQRARNRSIQEEIIARTLDSGRK